MPDLSMLLDERGSMDSRTALQSNVEENQGPPASEAGMSGVVIGETEGRNDSTGEGFRSLRLKRAFTRTSVLL